MEESLALIYSFTLTTVFQIGFFLFTTVETVRTSRFSQSVFPYVPLATFLLASVCVWFSVYCAIIDAFKESVVFFLLGLCNYLLSDISSEPIN